MSPWRDRRQLRPAGEELEGDETAGNDQSAARLRMVDRQLRRRGIVDERVLEAMATVPRELFLPAAERRQAYRDGALPIGHGQTISQPWIVAAIAQALAPGPADLVLDVGSGSGYSTAILAHLAREVIGIERIEDLAERSREVLRGLGVANATIVAGDGSEGLSERSPFDAIAVHATAPAAPTALLGQLEAGGRLVAPIACDRADMLTLYRRADRDSDPRTGAGFERATIGPTRFVPLIGRAGFTQPR